MIKYGGPVVLVVMDGVGLSQNKEGNAVVAAHTEFLNNCIKKYKTMALEASGEAVGILPGQMGNSEVGHNALGSGQIVKQGIAKIEDEFATGKIWEGKAWKGAVSKVLENNSTLHFSGIFSDGGVHSDINHMLKMIARAVEEGVRKIRVHLVLDGRDTPPKSAEKYVEQLENFIAEFAPLDIKIADGGGRMVFVADRYENDWNVVKKGWDAFVFGKADYAFSSAAAALAFFRTNFPDKNDQYLPSFIISDKADESGKFDESKIDETNLVKDGDAFIYIDFRADRAIEIAEAFTYDNFPYFDRGTENNRKLDVFFAGLTEYNSDTHVPEHRLVEPVEIKNPLNVVLAKNGLRQLAVAETVKFGHITYYFDGNSYEKVENEDFVEVPSDTLPFNERPWMKSAEVTDAVLEKLGDGYDFVRINFAAPDMVGHFGEMESTVAAMEAVDISLQRLAKKVDELGGMMIITADHGNAEELIDPVTHEIKTAHTTNLVPCIFYDNTENANKYELNRVGDAGISNVSPTIATLLGVSEFPEGWRESLIRVKE